MLTAKWKLLNIIIPASSHIEDLIFHPQSAVLEILAASYSNLGIMNVPDPAGARSALACTVTHQLTYFGTTPAVHRVFI